MNELLTFLLHHWVLSGGAALVFIALMIVEKMDAMQGSFRLTPQKVVEYINHHQAVLVDIRTLESFKKGHIIHAIHVPSEECSPTSPKLKSHQSSVVILIDADGEKASAVARQLTKAGYQKILMLAGGMRAWITAGLPLEKS